MPANPSSRLLALVGLLQSLRLISLPPLAFPLDNTGLGDEIRSYEGYQASRKTIKCRVLRPILESLLLVSLPGPLPRMPSPHRGRSFTNRSFSSYACRRQWSDGHPISRRSSEQIFAWPLIGPSHAKSSLRYFASLSSSLVRREPEKS